MPRFAANLSMLFTERPFPARFGAAAAAGFRGVECHFPYDYPAPVLAGALADSGLSQVLFNLPAGDWAAGERGIACHPDRREEFRAGVDTAIHYARALACPRVNCLAGRLPGGVSAECARECLIDNLRYAAPRLADAGVQLLVEPINTRDVPGFFLCRSDQALRVMDDAGVANLALQYDVYHMQVMEGDLVRHIESAFSRIGHVQVADNPGRHEPGTGEINYAFLFERLEALGYDGWVSAEYVPRNGTATGLDWLASYLQG